MAWSTRPLALLLLMLAATCSFAAERRVIQLSDLPRAPAKNISCQFGEGIHSTWDSGELKIEHADFGANGDISYQIDFENRTVSYTTDAGSGRAEVFVTAAGLTFVENFATGISMTTAFKKPDSTGMHQAVLSRHVDAFGPMPSQYYGLCQRRD